MAKLRVDVWGEVSPTPAAGAVSRIKVERCTGGGYLVLTVEGGRESDVWIETLEEVEAELEALQIDWGDA